MRLTYLLLPFLGLACGFLGEEPPPEPLEPFPLVLPEWVMSTWQRVVEVDDRPVIEIGCDGRIQTLDIGEAGHIALSLGSVTSRVQGSALELREDGSLEITLEEGGSLEVEETEDALLHVRAPTLGLAEPVLFADADRSMTERLLAPASRCGSEAMDLSGLAALTDSRFAALASPCMQPGLVLRLERARPSLRRAGLDYRVLAATPVEEGTWLTVQDEQGRRHGLRLDPQADGSVRIWQRTDRGMSSELLHPASGRCR